MHYSKIVEKRRLELEKQAAEATQALNKLTSDVVEAKFKKREELLLQVKAIETDLASMLDIPSEELFGTALSSKPRVSSSVASGDSAESLRGRRKSLPEELKLLKIADLLRANPTGLSAKEIAERIADTYNTISSHLAKHPLIYLKSGNKRSTVYSLIQ